MATEDKAAFSHFDEQGNACGEARFIGLFTSEVYSQSPNKIPLIRQKMAQIVANSDFVPGSHSFRMFNLVVDALPRDELYLSSY